MKFALFPYRRKNRSGIILVVVLWMMVILSVLSVGLGRRTGIDFALAKHSIGKLKADYAAWAGLLYALREIKKDNDDMKTGGFDTLFQCAVKLDENKNPADIFKGIPLNGSVFDVRYKMETDNRKTVVYGLEDEERKININAITGQNYKILSQLLTLAGFEEWAETIASSVVDWVDADATVTNSPLGSEDADYMALSKPYHCKNLPFDNIEELFLVKGMTVEIFEKIKDYITVFPRETPSFLVNVDTAPLIVIRALGRAVAGSMTNTEFSDADSLAEKIVAYRRGDDDKEFTSDDRKVDMNELGLNAKERIIFLASKGRMADVSHYLRINVRGTEATSSARSEIEAVIFRDTLSLVAWTKN